MQTESPLTQATDARPHRPNDSRCRCQSCATAREDQTEAAAREHDRTCQHEDNASSAGYDLAAIAAMLDEEREYVLVRLLDGLQPAVSVFGCEREATAVCRRRLPEIKELVAAEDVWTAWRQQRDLLAGVLGRVVAQANSESEFEHLVVVMSAIDGGDVCDREEQLRILLCLGPRERELARRRAAGPRNNDEPWSTADTKAFSRASKRVRATFEHEVRGPVR